MDRRQGKDCHPHLGFPSEILLEDHLLLSSRPVNESGQNGNTATPIQTNPLGIRHMACNPKAPSQ